jgi:hypothetical protein
MHALTQSNGQQLISVMDAHVYDAFLFEALSNTIKASVLFITQRRLTDERPMKNRDRAKIFLPECAENADGKKP